MRWPTVELQELALQQKGAIVSGPFGSNIGSRFFVEQGVPVIRGNNLTKGDGKFIDDGFVYLTDSKAAEFPNCIAVADDLVFTAAGSIGQVGLIPTDSSYERYVISNKQIRVRLDEGKAEPLFVYYWLSCKRMTRYLVGMNNGGAVPLLNLGIIRRVPIPHPKLETQKRIATILSAYDDLIENNRRRIQLLEQAARLLYREWFVHLRFPGHEHVKIKDGIPDGWERKTLEKLAEFNRKSLGKGFQGEIKYIDIASVSPGSIDGTKTIDFAEAPSRAKRIVSHGDIIWSCVRPNRKSFAVIWEPEINLVASTGFVVITPRRTVLMPFIYFSTTTQGYVDYLSNVATGAAYPAVKPVDFKKFLLLLPSEKFIKEFSEFCFPIFEQTNILQQQNIKLIQARDLLLPRLMNGEITV